MSTLSKNQFIRKIKSIFLQFLYGISITVPYSRCYCYEGVHGVILFSSWINFMILLFPFQKIGLITNAEVFCLPLIPITILYAFMLWKINFVTNYLDEIWIEKYYWLDVNSHKKEHYSELIRTHRNVSKYNRVDCPASN